LLRPANFRDEAIVVDVDAVDRCSCLHAQNLKSCRRGRAGAAVQQFLPHRVGPLARAKNIVTPQPKIIVAASLAVGAKVRPSKDGLGLRSRQVELTECLRSVGQLNLLADDEAIEVLHQLFREAGIHVEPEHILAVG
jgi:hypothetical protein